MSQQAKTSAAANTVHTGQEMAHEVVDQLKDGATQAVDSVKGAAARVQELASEQLEQWGDSASDFADERLDEVRQLKSVLVQHIRENPVNTLLLVAGGAFLLGAMWRGR